jgi:hypothetical protein
MGVGFKIELGGTRPTRLHCDEKLKPRFGGAFFASEITRPGASRRLSAGLPAAAEPLRVAPPKPVRGLASRTERGN